MQELDQQGYGDRGGRLDAHTIELLENLTRIYVIAQHEGREDPRKYEVDRGGVDEFLDNLLTSLIGMYDDARLRTSGLKGCSLASPREGHFRAIWLIFNMNSGQDKELGVRCCLPLREQCCVTQCFKNLLLETELFAPLPATHLFLLCPPLPYSLLQLKVAISKLPPSVLNTPDFQSALSMWSSIKLPNPTAFFRFFSRRSTSYLVKAILARHIPYMRQKSMEILLFNNSSKRRESALDASDPEVLQSLKAADEAALHPYKSPGSSPPKDFYSRQFLTWWDLAEKVGLPLSALYGLPLTLPSTWQGPSVNKNFMAKKREPNEPNCIFQAPESPRIPTSVLQAAEAVARLCALHTLQVFPSGCVASIALQSESYHTNTPLALHTHHTHTHTHTQPPPPVYLKWSRWFRHFPTWTKFHAPFSKLPTNVPLSGLCPHPSPA